MILETQDNCESFKSFGLNTTLDYCVVPFVLHNYLDYCESVPKQEAQQSVNNFSACIQLFKTIGYLVGTDHATCSHHIVGNNSGTLKKVNHFIYLIYSLYSFIVAQWPKACVYTLSIAHLLSSSGLSDIVLTSIALILCSPLSNIQYIVY